jgi:hypothetical protein
MPNLVTLRPGARGTIRLVHQYGDQLLFVRYRYNTDSGMRYKTIELIVDEQPWVPRRPVGAFLQAKTATGQSGNGVEAGNGA